MLMYDVAVAAVIGVLAGLLLFLGVVYITGAILKRRAKYQLVPEPIDPEPQPEPAPKRVDYAPVVFNDELRLARDNTTYDHEINSKPAAVELEPTPIENPYCRW